MKISDVIARLNLIVGPIVALALTGAYIYMSIVGIEVGREFYALLFGVVGNLIGLVNGHRTK
jgi:hypothetical protein